MTFPAPADATPARPTPARMSSGIAGLDEILGGGFDANRVYLVEGQPGSGKTTLALQFLLEGARQGERTLHICLSESGPELQLIAERHGWSLEGIELFDLSSSEASLNPDDELTVFQPSAVELSETTTGIIDRIKALKPTRVVFDSLSEMRIFAQSPLRYLRQIMALKHFFTTQRCTVLLLDDLSSQGGDVPLHSLAHGVVLLEQNPVDFGAERRRLRVIKMRGIEFKGGYHDFTIQRGGLEIYPRLVASEHHKRFLGEFTQSGNGGLDALLGGGLERGTNALFIGPAGVGKSTLALTFAVAAARRGDHAVIFAFDEGRGTIDARAKAIGLDIESLVTAGTLRIEQIDPAEMAPGEFTHLVRSSVERDKARIVVIDSLNGYLNAMPDERFLILQMHELLSYLSQMGVVAILLLAQHGLVGPMETPVDISYLSDAVLMLRYFEAEGRVRRALSVLKKRSGAHEDTIREYQLTSGGIKLGPPLTEFQGIFTGSPTYTGTLKPLMPKPTHE
jgi:circadian clock protein KaiC